MFGRDYVLESNINTVYLVSMMNNEAHKNASHSPYKDSKAKWVSTTPI